MELSHKESLNLSSSHFILCVLRPGRHCPSQQTQIVSIRALVQTCCQSWPSQQKVKVMRLQDSVTPTRRPSPSASSRRMSTTPRLRAALTVEPRCPVGTSPHTRFYKYHFQPSALHLKFVVFMTCSCETFAIIRKFLWTSGSVDPQRWGRGEPRCCQSCLCRPWCPDDRCAEQECCREGRSCAKSPQICLNWCSVPDDSRR